MFQNVILLIVGLIVISFLIKKIKFTLHARDLIAWSMMVGLMTGTYITYIYELRDFQIWAAVLIFFFITSVLLSYYGVIFKR